MLGRPHTSVYLFQPEGMDGDTDFCFAGKTDLTKLTREEVDAVIFLSHVDRSRVEEDSWYVPSFLKHYTSTWQRIYVSLSLGRVVHEDQRLDYDLRLPFN